MAAMNWPMTPCWTLVIDISRLRSASRNCNVASVGLRRLFRRGSAKFTPRCFLGLSGEQSRAGLASGDQRDRQQRDGGDGPQWRSVAVRIRRWNQGGHDGAGHQPAVEQEAEEERRRRALLTVRRAEDEQRKDAGADQRETDQG